MAESIKIEHVSFQYENAEGGALHDVSLTFARGECVLLCGKSGCGKTTLTRLVNGLIPHYYEGKLTGRVTVNGLDVTQAELYETAKQVGSVFQNPRSQFFCVDTTSEIAFGCENLGLPVPEIERRIEKAAEELRIKTLLGRNIFELSGGEKQKVACASVSAVRPAVLVLDEPTSNLDMDAIEDLKKTLLLWKAQGKTILIAEHRLSWLRDVCDRAIYMDAGRVGFDIPMEQLAAFPAQRLQALGLRAVRPQAWALPKKPQTGGHEMGLEDFQFAYASKQALSIPSLSLPVGGIVAVIGHNGAGKSTFCRCLCGLEKHFKGRVRMGGTAYARKAMLNKSYLVMQDVNHQLFCESVEDEAALGMADENQNAVAEVLARLDLAELADRHPMSLSGGQKQRVAIASALLVEKEILIFDEPTSGLDFAHMEQTAQLLRSLAGEKTLFVITHDPELIVRCCTQVLHLEQGVVSEQYSLTEENTARFAAFFAEESSAAPQKCSV